MIGVEALDGRAAAAPVAVWRPPRWVRAWAIALLGAVGLLLVVSGGNVALACVPVVLSIAGYVVWRAPMRRLMLGLLAVGLVVEIPGERPFTGLWQSPFYPIGALLYDNLNNVFHVQALRFSGLDVVVIGLATLAVARVLGGHLGDAQRREPGANVMSLAFAVAFLAIVWLELWGLARGGDFKNSLWQIRQLLWLPVLGALFTYGLRGREDFRVVARTIVVAACIKVALGLWFLLAVARPQGIAPAYVTSHGDSVLYAVGAAICIGAWLHRPTRAHLLLNLTATPWILIGIGINNRRLAFVSLLGALAAMYFMLEGRVKRAIRVAMIWSAPLVLLYLAVGTVRPRGIFAPAAMLTSVLRQKDASSETRDIENYNLLITLKEGKILGAGFGHEYHEVSKAYDISQYFSQYRYIAHNSVLWLWSIAGLVGFTAIWFMLAVGIFLATRAYRFAYDWHDRTAAATVIAIIIAYMVQAWGDMGMLSWGGTLLLAVGLALAGKLAVATGAWPSAREVRLA